MGTGKAASNFRVGLALGGGAARGLAHIGVIKVLRTEGVPVDLIVGTSIGALVGGAFAVLGDPVKLEERFRRFVRGRDFRRTEFDFLKESRQDEPSFLYSAANLIKRGVFYSLSMTQPSFVPKENFLHNIHSLVEDLPIEAVKVPFAAVAADLQSGEAVILSSGSIRQAVSASSAIPGLMPPVEVNGRTLIDGGWVSKVPVLEAFRLGADMVIASDVSQELDDASDLSKGLNVLIRANAIKADALKEFQCRLADVVVRPRVNHVHWADFVEALSLIEEGERAARARLGDIQALLDRARWRTRLGFSRGKRLAKAFY